METTLEIGNIVKSVSIYELREVLERALKQAIQQSKQFRAMCRKDRNQRRSSKFVKSLAMQFEDYYASSRNVRVWLAGRPSEFLHDISIVETDVIGGPLHTNVEIDRIVNVLWQVESEMENDGREFMRDLNKLCAGTSDSDKLYVVSESWSSEQNLSWVTDQLQHVAQSQNGRIFLAFIPHPDFWDSIEPSVDLIDFS